MSQTTLIIAMTALLSVVLAQSNSTASNATTGDDMIGWVSPDARRSTWDIIWSCLSIFLVCSWKCVHLNVPSEEESRGKWHKVSLWGWDMPYWPKRPLFRKWGRKLMWMGIIAIAPEMGVALALKQRLDARDTWKSALQDLNREDRRKYTMAHAFYVKMGGIIIRRLDTQAILRGTATEQASHKMQEDITPAEAPLPKTPPIPMSIEHSVRVDTQEDKDADDLEKMSSNSGDGIFESDYYIKELKYLKHPSIVSRITEEDIMDRSKADAFTKVFALVQSSWLVAQSIARVVRGLAISQLELATMAFVFCALIMYILWWEKPFNAERRHVIMSLIDPKQIMLHDYIEICHKKCRLYDLDLDEFRDLVLGANMYGGKHRLPAVALYMSGMAFSAIHLAAWNWEFPSLLVGTLWRWFAMIAFVASFLPFILFIISKLIDMLHHAGSTIHLIFVYGLGVFTLVSYVVSRLVILVLTFYCFVSMPASAYEKVEWTGFLPHFS